MSLPAGRVYAPTIHKGSTYYSLPLPIESAEETYGVRVSAEDIPLVTGTLVTNVVRGGLALSFSGMIVKDNPGAVLREKDEMESLLLDAPAIAFDFFRYYCPAASYYRWYPDCFVTSLRFAYSAKTVLYLPYTLGVLCTGGREYVSGTFPGDSESSGSDDVPGVTATLGAPLLIDLDSTDGSSAVIFRNSNQEPIARLKSNGDLEIVGQIVEVTELIS